MSYCYQCIHYQHVGCCNDFHNGNIVVEYYGPACPFFKDKNKIDMEENTTRKCSVCGREKPLEDFPRHGKGYSFTCKECREKMEEAAGEGPLGSPFEDMPDAALMEELRRRGWRGTLRLEIEV